MSFILVATAFAALAPSAALLGGTAAPAATLLGGTAALAVSLTLLGDTAATEASSATLASTPAALRHLIVWRGRSRHTYGFEGTFDVPMLELSALLPPTRSGAPPVVALAPMPPPDGEEDSLICWADVATVEAQAALVEAASRAVLVHAVFVVIATAASLAAVASAARDAGLRDPEAVDVIDLSEPNLRAEARAAVLSELGLGWSSAGGGADAGAGAGGGDASAGREWVLIREAGTGTHHVGWWVASGAAASSGAPGRAVRRPAGGLLGRYALKRRRHNAATAIEPELGEDRHTTWPSPDILSRLGFCARINHPFIAPPACIAHTVTLLLQNHCAIFDPSPTPRFYAIHHTILCIAISCKG